MTEKDKNNSADGSDCINRETIYVNESKRMVFNPIKDEPFLGLLMDRGMQKATSSP